MPEVLLEAVVLLLRSEREDRLRYHMDTSEVDGLLVRLGVEP